MSKAFGRIRNLIVGLALAKAVTGLATTTVVARDEWCCSNCGGSNPYSLCCSADQCRDRPGSPGGYPVCMGTDGCWMVCDDGYEEHKTCD